MLLAPNPAIFLVGLQPEASTYHNNQSQVSACNLLANEHVGTVRIVAASLVQNLLNGLIG